MDYVYEGLLGNFHEFKTTVSTPIQRGLHSDAPESDKELAKALVSNLKESMGPYLLRREKQFIMQQQGSPLPPKVDMVIWLPLTRKQRSIYKKVLKAHEDLLAEGNGIKGLSFMFMHILKKLCDHPLKMYDFKDRINKVNEKIKNKKTKVITVENENDNNSRRKDLLNTDD